MRKYLGIVLLMGIVLCVMTGCRGNSKVGKGSLAEAVDSLKGRKALVVYFSRAGENYLVGTVEKGNTAFLAEYIADMTGADIFELKSEKNYDIPYKQMLDMVRDEKESGEEPGYDTTIKDVSQYDVVFVGGPIWWGTYPRLFIKFFRDFDLDGKILIPFTTNEGSGLGSAPVDLKAAYPNAKILPGFTMTGQEARKPEARETVETWLRTFSYDAAPADITVDATTGATESVKPLTEEGKRLEENKAEKVSVTFSDGTTQEITLIVQGMVDMGDGLLWSSVNLGATMPWESGAHYAWGERESKDEFTADNYKWNGKAIGESIAGTWYDAARAQFGGQWRMPTCDEWHTLITQTQHEFVTINGKPGELFTAKNGSRLFIPANGYIYGKEVGTPNEGFYWSATSTSVGHASSTYFPGNSWGQSNYEGATGLGIRAVRQPFR